jgi:peptide deformylase
MALLTIITAPDPRLKVKSRPVERVDASVRKLMDDMLDTMYAAPGIGLAAAQVGIAKRVLVVDVAREGEPPAPLRMANPEVTWTSEETISMEEGCLSLPDEYASVQRPARCRVRYLDHENEPREIAADGLLAACIQHEIDHLEGVLFVDHISTLKRGIILRRLQKARKSKQLQPA